ncbi:MAG: diadenylate cyclase CdaA [Bacteroidales bacterium]|nr:diadenylate cyclase CdaA [Bacteroidales bacterium]MDY2916750.1 diadenylate cyclase CdaA [Muribaculaceae bacterium]
MMFEFTIKDAIDILVVAVLLYYVFRLMKESGTLSIFYGAMVFIVIWLIASEIFKLRLIGSILDKFMSIGLLILVILFQDQIKRFLTEMGSRRRFGLLRKMLRHKDEEAFDVRRIVMPIVYACMSMSKSKTGALIVVQGTIPLDQYARSGDIINAEVNTRLIENIFFKNSPLHDGAMIISGNRIVAAGCILPVSHDTSIPRSLGLRHRSALGIAQATDAMAVVVSEETGKISVAYRGKLDSRLSSTDLEQRLTEMLIQNMD